MAEDPEKYKQILKREDEEFQEANESRSKYLFLYLLNQSEKWNSGKTRAIAYFTLTFAIFF